MTYRHTYGRGPALALECMVATSQPRATYVGLRMLERGGNAVDAALAAAAVLCVTEPMSTGLGGDVFAIVWQEGELAGLDAAGPAPRAAVSDEPVAERGARSVTVPGAAAGWALLNERYGRLGLDACLADAIDIAENGFAVGRMAAEAWDNTRVHSASWAKAAVPPEFAPVPLEGARVRIPDLARTFRHLADEGPDYVYRGALAEAICAVSWLEEPDLADYTAAWCTPLRARYRSVEVAELPPPTQGVAALEALALLEGLEPTLVNQARCARLALEDALETVRDGAHVSHLLAPAKIAARRSDTPDRVREPAGATVYLCAVDSDGTAVSLIQSLFGNFGSGIVAPGSGVVLQNRGACFAIQGGVEPGRRPYHTIIPGMLLSEDDLLGPFGVMGGHIQAQAHMQLVSGIIDHGLDAQAALDRSRFRVDGERIFLEEGLWGAARELEHEGYDVVLDDDTVAFGGGQVILRRREGLAGGSDPRKDGYAAGF